MTAVLLLALLTTPPVLAADEHRAPMLEPEGLWQAGPLAMPGPPDGCKARIIVEQDGAICSDPRLAELVDSERMASVKAGSLDPAVLPTWYQTTASPDAGVGCSFGCDPTTKVVRWIVSVGSPGYRGPVRCTVGQVAALELQLGEVGTPVPDGAGAMWLTDLSHFGFSFDFPEDALDGLDSSKTLSGDNLCPAGQPTRGGGVVGAFATP